MARRIGPTISDARLYVFMGKSISVALRCQSLRLTCIVAARKANNETDSEVLVVGFKSNYKSRSRIHPKVQIDKGCKLR